MSTSDWLGVGSTAVAALALFAGMWRDLVKRLDRIGETQAAGEAVSKEHAKRLDRHEEILDDHAKAINDIHVKVASK